MRTVWLNGEFLPETEAKVSIFDRGLLFAQGVYEVSPVLDGHYCNWPYHAARLERDGFDDIFDHLLAILPEFGLRLFQQPAGADFRSGRAGAWLTEGRQEREVV